MTARPAPPDAPHVWLADIDVLRGIAIIMVYIQHLIFLVPPDSGLAVFQKQVWHGAAGVDLFFAISGFVIARTLLPKLAAATDLAGFGQTALTFLLRRFWRLTPSAWLWVAIAIGLAASCNQAGQFGPLHANVAGGLAAVFSYYNVWFAALPHGLFEAGSFSTYWTLSLEEQFYLCLPLAVLLLRRRLVWLMFGVLAYQFCMPETMLSLITRPGSLAVGVLLALWHDSPTYGLARPAFLQHSAWSRFGFIGVVLFLIGALESPLSRPLYAVPFGLVAVLSGLLVYTASFDCGMIVGQGAARRMLVWVGARSYAIYLVHMPLFALSHEITHWAWAGALWRGHPTTFLLVCSAAMTLACAEITHRYVEQPGRRYGRTLHVRLGKPGLRAVSGS